MKRSRVSLIMVRASPAASANKLFYPNHDSVERRPQLATKRRERRGPWASRKPPGAPGSSLGTGPGGVMHEQWRLINYPPEKRDVLLIFNYIHNAALTWREKLAMCGGEQTHSTPLCLWDAQSVLAMNYVLFNVAACWWFCTKDGQTEKENMSED